MAAVDPKLVGCSTDGAMFMLVAELVLGMVPGSVEEQRMCWLKFTEGPGAYRL